MISDDVNTAFELLIEAFANSVDRANAEGAEVLRRGEHQHAEACIKKARSLSEFSKKVSELQAVWLSEMRSDAGQENGDDAEPRSSHGKGGQDLSMNYNGASAKALYHDKRVTLLEGSIVREETLPSLADNYRELRKRSKADGTLVSTERPDLLRLTRSMAFSSPSGAAQFVAGCSVSGNRDWLTDSGQTLGQWLKAQRTSQAL